MQKMMDSMQVMMHKMTESVLDVMLNTSELDVISTTVGDNVGSDHLPLIVELDWPIALNSARKSYCFSKADWNCFQHICNQRIHLPDFQFCPDTTLDDVDQRISVLTQILQEAIQMSVPRFHRRHQESQMAPELASLIQQKRAKKRQYARTGQLQLKRECALLTKRIRYLSSTIENSWHSSNRTRTTTGTCLRSLGCLKARIRRYHHLPTNRTYW